MSHEPEMSDAQFTNVFSIMIGGLILLTIALIILAAIIASDVSQSNINQQVRDSQMVERIEPAGQVAVGDVTAGSGSSGETAVTDASSGESVYQSSCAACHAAGVAGAPKLGDTAAWSERADKGIETLYDHAINGFQGEAGMMPAKGGNASLSDEEVKAAVDYMIEGSTPGGGSATAATEDSASTSSDGAGTSGSASDTSSESGTADSSTEATDDSGASVAAAGESVYQSACAACHNAGVAGAPTLGDAAVWSDRVSKGTETLYDHAINGFQGEAGMMPPKGGFTNLSDAEVRAAVDYMLEAVQ